MSSCFWPKPLQGCDVSHKWSSLLCINQGSADEALKGTIEVDPCFTACSLRALGM